MTHDSPPASRVGRLWSVGVDVCELHRCEVPAASCPLRSEPATDTVGGTTRQCLDITTIDDALQRLAACATSADDMSMLRGVVRDSGFELSRMTNHQVLDLAAGMLARRELCVAVVRTSALTASAPKRVESSPTPTVMRTPSQLRPRIEEPALVDEIPNVPAAMLIDAARTGVPFCEH